MANLASTTRGQYKMNKMRKTLLILYLLSVSNTLILGQFRLTQDSCLEKQILESGLIHQPLPLNTENSFETNGWKKEILQSVPLVSSGNLKLQFPTYTGKRAVGPPSDPDYATYGNNSVSYHLNGANLENTTGLHSLSILIVTAHVWLI